MMKTHNRGTHLVLLLDVEEATWWQQRGFEDDSCKSTINCAVSFEPTRVKRHMRVSRRASPLSESLFFAGITAVSTEAWHAIL